MGLSPKNCLVYQLYRDAQAAKIYFETGLMRTYANTRSITRSDYPFTVCNRFYQQEIMIDEGTVGTGRETPLTGLIDTDLHS